MLTNFDIAIEIKKMEIPNFRGIYSKNFLPSIRKNGFYIVNLDDDKKGHNGTHWVCAYERGLDKDSEYFDSFGVVPPKEILEFLSSPIKSNNKQIQDFENSDACGWFCIYVIKQWNKGRAIDSIMNDFYDTLLIRNDAIVKKK